MLSLRSVDDDDDDRSSGQPPRRRSSGMLPPLDVEEPRANIPPHGAEEKSGSDDRRRSRGSSTDRRTSSHSSPLAALMERQSATTYEVDASLEEAMAAKNAELAALGVEDLDRLRSPIRNNDHSNPLARRRLSSQYEIDDGGNGDIEFTSAELDTEYHEGMTPAETVQRACATVFIVLELEQSSTFARYLDYVTKTVIILAIVAYLLSTEPTYRYTPTTCDQPVCNDDLTLCPGYVVCQDVEIPELWAVEEFTTYYFTAEYILRMLTVWSVSPRVAGLLSSEWEHEHSIHPDLPQPAYSPWFQTAMYFWRFKLIIDLATIFPSYLPYLTPNGIRVNTNFIRTLRLLRLVRLLKMFRLLTFLKNVDVAMDIIWGTLRKSSTMLGTFMLFILVFFVFMGCLVYTAEQGTFTVNAQYPNGAYLKMNDDENGVKVSNIQSAVKGIYWAVGGGTGNSKCRAPFVLFLRLQLLIGIPSSPPWQVTWPPPLTRASFCSV